MIKNNDKNILDKVERSDLHCHIDQSKLKKDFEDLNQIKLLEPIILGPIKKTDEWCDENTQKYIEGSEAMEQKYKSLFNGANLQNIKAFSPAFCSDNIKYSNNDIREYLKYINAIKEKCAPNINLYPELQLRREIEQKELEKLFLAALNLEAINHGLSASQSYDLIKYLAESRNMLNICPTSNILLPRVESYKGHPNKIIVDNGILYLLDSDDLLILNQILSNENLNLYNNDILIAKELNDIRTNDFIRRLTKKR